MSVSWGFASWLAGSRAPYGCEGRPGAGMAGMAGEWLVPLVKSIRWFSVVSMRGQVNEPGCGGTEAAGIEVEPREMLFEIHAQPLAPGRLGVTGSMADKRRGDPLPLTPGGDLGVEEEGVITPVPCHVDKAD